MWVLNVGYHMSLFKTNTMLSNIVTKECCQSSCNFGAPLKKTNSQKVDEGWAAFLLRSHKQAGNYSLPGYQASWPEMDDIWIFFCLVLFVWTSRTGSSLSAFHGGTNFLLVCGSPAVTFRRTSSRLTFKKCAWDKWLFWWTIEPDLCQDPWRAVMKKTPLNSRWAETRSSVVYGKFFPHSWPFFKLIDAAECQSTSQGCTFIQWDKRM